VIAAASEVAELVPVFATAAEAELPPALVYSLCRQS
jgi:hypothetical protein